MMSGPRAPFRRYHRRRTRGVSPIIAVILLVGLTVVAAGVLYAFRLSFPGAPLQVSYYENYNNTRVTVYGEDNGPGSNQCPAPYYICTMNGSTVTITAVESNGPVLFSNIQVVFTCGGHAVLSGSLKSIMDPYNNTGNGGGNNGPSCPSPSNPPKCINPPATGVALIREVYFVPLTPEETALTPGDTFYLYGSSCNVNVDRTAGDDPYGPPPICATAGECDVVVYVYGNVNGVFLTIPVVL